MQKTSTRLSFLFIKLQPIFDLKTIFDDFSANNRSTKAFIIHYSLVHNIQSDTPALYLVTWNPLVNKRITDFAMYLQIFFAIKSRSSKLLTVKSMIFGRSVTPKTPPPPIPASLLLSFGENPRKVPVWGGGGRNPRKCFSISYSSTMQLQVAL